MISESNVFICIFILVLQQVAAQIGTGAEFGPVIGIGAQSQDGFQVLGIGNGVGLLCQDSTTTCKIWTQNGFCSNTAYTSAQKYQYCARSCNLCQYSPNFPSITCTDSNYMCSQWAQNGFCSNTVYTNDQKRQYCARSCNLCYY
ncbi:unnamed protein product, partial [Mesorhabditis belari]|uniref:ShKT domain-containing protein n=1 Tax=Mesorhabditis belari TaxID=2138241 RepID=A0AAF3FP40_9BILA